MKINSVVFNDAVNINNKFVAASETGDDERLSNLDDDYGGIMRRIALRDADPEDLHDRIKENIKDGSDKAAAVEDARDDLADEAWADGTLQLWFVPDETVLGDALRLYYDHVNGGGWIEGAKKSARSCVMSNDGFYFATGLGYCIKDELFSGVPIKATGTDDGVGTGKPFKRFLDYINSVNY